MLHVVVVAFVLFANPATGDVQPAQAVTASPLACADLLNAHHTVQTEDGQTYYMIKAECHGYYVDANGNAVGDEGNYTQPKAHHHAAKHRPL